MKSRKTSPKKKSKPARTSSATSRGVLWALLAVSLAFLLTPVGYARFGKPGVYMETWPDGSAKVRALSKRTADGDYIFDGLYVAFHPNGRKEREGEMRNGKEEGGWTWWTETGTKLAEGDFQAGSGTYTSFHANGQKSSRGGFARGQRDGVWTEWDENGRKIREGPYVDGQRHGDWTYWHEEDATQTMTVRWDRGVMREAEADPAAPSPAPSGSPRESSEADVSFLLHVLQILLLTLVLVGPIPLALTLLAASSEERDDLLLAHVALVVITAWVGLQTAAGLFLGVLHQLHPAGLAILEIALFGIGLWLLRRRWHALPWSRWAIPPRSHRPAEVAVTLALAVTALTAVWWLLALPTDNFDSLAYHLPTMIRWTQEHSLVRMPELGQVAFYPFHWEVLGTLLLLPLREDLAAALPNLLAWVLAGLSIYLLARRLDVSKLAAKLAAALLLSVPILLARLPAIQPDMALGAFFLVTLYLGGMFATREHRPRLLVLAIAVSVLLGLKTSALAYVAAALVIVLLERWSAARRGGVTLSSLLPSASRREMATAMILVVVVGGFWYLRNWIDTGNPLGFVQVKLGGFEVLSGMVGADELRRGSLARVFELTNAAHWGILWQVAREHLALPFAVLVLALLGFPLRGRRSGVPTAAQSALLMALVLATFLLYWFSPYGADNGAENWQLTPRISAGLRFGFAFLMVLALASAVGLATARRGAEIVSVLAVAACVLGVTLTVQPPFVVLIVALGIGLAAIVLLQKRPPALTSGRGIWGLLAVALLLGIGVAYVARGMRDEWRSTFYGKVYDYVEINLGPADVLGYALTQTRSPFYGKHLDRRLVSVVPRSASREEWLEQLDADGVGYLLVGTTTANELGQVAEKSVRDWVEAENAPFERLLDYQSRKRDVSLYRYLRPAATTQP